MQVTGSIDASSTISVKQVEVATGTAVSSSFAQKSAVSSSFALKSAISGSFGNQSVGTADSPTFAGVTTTGTLTAQTVTAEQFHTTIVSSSILYQSGSTKFGDSSDDIHQFTGSLHLVNSGSVSGSSTSRGSFGHVIVGGNNVPTTDNSHNLGSAALRWANVYTADLHLNNEGNPNTVDGTTGNWTVQEGEDYIYIVNNKSNKKFKLMLEEIE